MTTTESRTEQISQSETSQHPEKYVLNYFNRHGKIELCRLIFAAANIPYKDNYSKNLTDSDSEAAFTPYLETENVQIPLISVISRFLAKEFNLVGESNLEQAKADAIAQTAMILIDDFYRNVFNIEDTDVKKINYKEFHEKKVPECADVLENLINMYSNKGQWCLGENFTYADLFVYEAVNRYFPSDNDLLMEKYPLVFAIKNKVAEKSPVSDYIAKSATQKHDLKSGLSGKREE